MPTTICKGDEDGENAGRECDFQPVIPALDDDSDSLPPRRRRKEPEQRPNRQHPIHQDLSTSIHASRKASHNQWKEDPTDPRHWRGRRWGNGAGGRGRGRGAGGYGGNGWGRNGNGEGSGNGDGNGNGNGNNDDDGWGYTRVTASASMRTTTSNSGKAAKTTGPQRRNEMRCVHCDTLFVEPENPNAYPFQAPVSAYGGGGPGNW